jgi:hypothetical protein
MTRLLIAMDGWEITNGQETLPSLPTAPAEGAPAAAVLAYEAKLEKATDKQVDYKRRKNDAAAAMYNACSVGVRIYIDDSFDPAAMWKTLDERVNTAGTSVGRAELYNAFTTIRPIPGHPIVDFFTQLLEIRNQDIGTDKAIPDMIFKSHVCHSLPEAFDITVRILQREKDLSVEGMIDALKRDETFRMLKSPPDAATDAFYTSGPGRRNQQSNSKGGKWCTFCKRSTHNTDECFTKPGGNKNRKRRHPDNEVSNQCWHCAGTGHQARNCPVKEAAREAKNRFYKKVHPNVETTSGQSFSTSGEKDHHIAVKHHHTHDEHKKGVINVYHVSS